MPSRPLTILFMPESAYGPTNNCIGIGDVLRRRGHRVVFAAEASWKGKLEPLGFEEDLVDLRRARRGRPGRRAVLEGLRRATRRRSSASRRSSSWRPGSSRSGRSSSTAPGTASRTAPRDRRAGQPRRHRRGQRGRFPGAGDRRRAVRADRVLQPAGDQGPRRAAHVLRVPGRRPGRMGRVPGRVRPDAPPAVAGLQRLVHGAGRAVPARPGVHRRGRRQPLRLPGAGRLPAGAAARADLAPARLLGAGDRRAVHAAARAGRRRRR